MLAVLLAPSPALAQRDQFIEHLIGFQTLLAGRYGDEGPRVEDHLERMAAAVAVWDEASRVAEGELRTRAEAVVPPGVQRPAVHAGLALLYTRRGQQVDALREIEAAIVADPQRAASHLLRGRLLEARGRDADAAAAYARAWELDRSNLVATYLAFTRRPDAGESDGTPDQFGPLLEAHRRGATLGAVPFLELALIPDGASTRPVFAMASYAGGFRLIAAGQYADALEQFRDAVARDPLIHQRAAQSAPMSRGIALLRDGRMRDAIAPLESAAARQPDSSEVHRILGAAHGAAGNDQQAIEHLREAVRLSPRDERTALALGQVLRDTGRLVEAEEALRAAIAAIPESAEARWVLGDVLQKAGRGLEAVGEMEAAGSGTVIAGKAAIYWRAAEISDRRQDFERVLRLLTVRARVDPNNAALHKDLGNVQSRLGHRNPALVEFLVADLLRGGDVPTLTAIGLNHLASARYADAEAVLRRVIALQPERPQARYGLGRALLRLGRTEDAREQLDVYKRLITRAMAEQRRNFEVDKLRADASMHASAGRHEAAAAMWETIVQQVPNLPAFRMSAAEALTLSGQFERAASHLEAAVGLGAGPDVHRRLASVYARLGRHEASEDARRTYEQRVQELLRAPSPRPE